MSHPEWMLSPLTEEQGQLICTWRYPAPYDIYNWPDWPSMVADHYEYADPLIRMQQYIAACDGKGRLVGFAQLFPLEGWTRLGLGLHPELCGQGLGRSFVQAVVQATKQKAPSNQIDLEVLTWNVRAIRTYKAAGFVTHDTYVRPTPNGTTGQFHCMVATETP